MPLSELKQDHFLQYYSLKRKLIVSIWLSLKVISKTDICLYNVTTKPHRKCGKNVNM